MEKLENLFSENLKKAINRMNLNQAEQSKGIPRDINQYPLSEQRERANEFPYFRGILELGPFIDSIAALEVQKFVLVAFKDCVSPLFWVLPASLTGKYHPDSNLGVGGLVRHTKATLIIANELFNIQAEFTPYEKDLIKAALMLHDICKPDKLHPILVKKQLYALHGYACYKPIINLIESHMGQWTEGGQLPEPQTKIQRFVHMCDYLSSRQNIMVKMY